MKLTARQEYIAAISNNRDYDMWLGNIYETKAEIKEIRELAAEHWWFMGESFDAFCAYSPEGNRKCFSYFMFDGQSKVQTLRWKRFARRAAKLWAAGEKRLSRDVYRRIDAEVGQW